MPRLKPDQWSIVRIEWETDPTVGYEAAAKRAANAGGFKLPGKATVADRAKREGWQKLGQCAAINEGAVRRADAASDPNRTETEQKPDTSGNLKKFAARSESEEKRAAVLVRHREEWMPISVIVRDVQYRYKQVIEADKASNSVNKDQWWRAKIASDILQTMARGLFTKQQGEREAWGFDRNNDDGKPLFGTTPFALNLRGLSVIELDLMEKLAIKASRLEEGPEKSAPSPST